MMIKRLMLLLSAAGIASSAQAATQVYFQNFDAAPTTAAGVVVTQNDNGAALTTTQTTGYGFSGQFLRNRGQGNPAPQTFWTLSNLPSHTSVTLNYVLGLFDSWDATSSGDYLDLLVGDNVVAQLSSDNASGSGEPTGGGTVLAESIQLDDNVYFSDRVVSMANAPALTFAHTGSTLTFGIRASGTGWQGSTDESWGVDNVSVTLDGVAPPTSALPEPASWAMMLIGFGGIGSVMRRRRRVGSVATA